MAKRVPIKVLEITAGSSATGWGSLTSRDQIQKCIVKTTSTVAALTNSWNVVSSGTVYAGATYEVEFNCDITSFGVYSVTAFGTTLSVTDLANPLRVTATYDGTDWGVIVSGEKGIGSQGYYLRDFVDSPSISSGSQLKSVSVLADTFIIDSTIEIEVFSDILGDGANTGRTITISLDGTAIGKLDIEASHDVSALMKCTIHLYTSSGSKMKYYCVSSVSDTPSTIYSAGNATTIETIGSSTINLAAPIAITVQGDTELTTGGAITMTSFTIKTVI